MNNEPPPHVIEAQHLCKVFHDFWYRPRVKAVRDVTFHVRRGEVFGLLGPNGSGKSTTLKMLLGLLQPTHGSLLVLNRSPRDVRAKAKVGYLPEETYLYPYLTARETLHFYGKLFDLNKRERIERIEQLIEMIGLQHVGNRMVGEFSKGMARRIGLAQALINDPELVVLDEPTSGLDPLGTRQVKDLILALAERGKTVVLSSHLLADVEDVCDRVAILYSGELQAMGTLDELLEEKQRHRLTLPEMDAATWEQLLREIRSALGGQEPQIDHPRRNLEQFFVDVVKNARTQSMDESGVAHTEGVARYLEPDKAKRLKDLTHATEEPMQDTGGTPQTDLPSKETDAAGRKKLDDLTASDRTSHE